jgi:hypothetical protein
MGVGAAAVVEGDEGAAVVLGLDVVAGLDVVDGLDDELLHPARPRATTDSAARVRVRTRDMEWFLSRRWGDGSRADAWGLSPRHDPCPARRYSAPTEN